MMEDEHTRRFFKVGKISDIPDSGVKVFKAGKKNVLVAVCEGQVYAIDDRCTHDDGPLGEGELLDGCEVECPRHGARFSLKTGKALCLPAVGDICWPSHKCESLTSSRCAKIFQSSKEPSMVNG